MDVYSHLISFNDIKITQVRVIILQVRMAQTVIWLLTILATEISNDLVCPEYFGLRPRRVDWCVFIFIALKQKSWNIVDALLLSIHVRQYCRVSNRAIYCGYDLIKTIQSICSVLYYRLDWLCYTTKMDSSMLRITVCHIHILNAGVYNLWIMNDLLTQY